MEKIGVLIINLGTPSAPNAEALKDYLNEFLSDRCIVDLPPLLWQPILKQVILRRRPARSAALYQKIWLENGSPLLVYSQRLANKLEQQLSQQLNYDVAVVLAMRYGQPKLSAALDKLSVYQPNKLVILPLYPQYAEASTGSSLLAIQKILTEKPIDTDIHTLTDYHDFTNYIETMANHIGQQRQSQQLVFSFHGIPQRCVDRGSPYYQHCLSTARLIANKLSIPPSQWHIAFQSRFGAAKWLQPYCDEVLKKLAADGYQRVDIVCPGFAVDCLETLEEVAIGYQETFQHAGGKQLHYISALNESDTHAKCLSELIKQKLNIT